MNVIYANIKKDYVTLMSGGAPPRQSVKHKEKSTLTKDTRTSDVKIKSEAQVFYSRNIRDTWIEQQTVQGYTFSLKTLMINHGADTCYRVISNTSAPYITKVQNLRNHLNKYKSDHQQKIRIELLKIMGFGSTFKYEQFLEKLQGIPFSHIDAHQHALSLAPINSYTVNDGIHYFKHPNDPIPQHPWGAMGHSFYVRWSVESDPLEFMCNISNGLTMRNIMNMDSSPNATNRPTIDRSDPDYGCVPCFKISGLGEYVELKGNVYIQDLTTRRYINIIAIPNVYETHIPEDTTIDNYAVYDSSGYTVRGANLANDGAEVELIRVPEHVIVGAENICFTFDRYELTRAINNGYNPFNKINVYIREQCNNLSYTAPDGMTRFQSQC